MQMQVVVIEVTLGFILLAVIFGIFSLNGLTRSFKSLIVGFTKHLDRTDKHELILENHEIRIKGLENGQNGKTT